jgi:RNA polymerase sigma-70 factor (ECF subfamily)
MYATRDEHTAVDVVQDAMLKLTERYSDKPAAELPLLFQRILQNTIHDHFRRQKVRSTWTVLLSALGHRDEREEDHDPLDTLAVKVAAKARMAREQWVFTLPSEHPMAAAVSATSSSSQ